MIPLAIYGTDCTSLSGWLVLHKNKKNKTIIVNQPVEILSAIQLKQALWVGWQRVSVDIMMVRLLLQWQQT